jgi:hypothetical protein
MCPEEYHFHTPDEALIRSRSIIAEKRQSIRTLDELVGLTEMLIRDYRVIDPQKADLYTQELEKYKSSRDDEALIKQGIEEFYDFVYKQVYGTLPN